MCRFLFFILLFFSSNSGAQEVAVAGTMKAIMQKADFSSKAHLDSFQKKDLYALGPLAALAGEFLVINGVVHASFLDGDVLHNRKDIPVEAGMMVYSYVPSWKIIDTMLALPHMAALDTLLATLSANSKVTEPFAFLLELEASGRAHVISWKNGVEHTPDNHKQFAKELRLEAEKIRVLGFYSRKHQGIFTHHSSHIHAHMLRGDGTIGHLDAISSTGSIRLLLPSSLF